MQDLTPASAHAKVNLRLEVAARGSDGYHALRTIFQSLELHDTLDFEPRPGPFAIECDDPAVPADERNLVWRAAVLSWQAAGRRGQPEGVRVRIHKRIPAQGGLGGGSADAAVALAAFARIWSLDPDQAARHRLARELGADVPFFFCGGTAAATGRGDELTPLPDLPTHHVLLVFPPFGVSTADAYAWLDADRAGGSPPGSGAEAGFARNGGEGAAEVCLADGTPMKVVNDLEPPVASRHPEIGRIRGELVESGAAAAAMSGSGSTVFGLYRDEGRALAAAGALTASGWRVAVTRTATRRRATRFLV